MMWYEPTDNWHKLAADINKLALEAYEEIMGFDPDEGGPGASQRSGHKPMRQDIQKLYDLWKIQQKATDQTTNRPNPGEPQDTWNPEKTPADPEQAELWAKMTKMTPAEQEIFEDFEKANVADDFEGTVRHYEERYPDLANEFNGDWHYPPDAPDNWKDVLASAIRKKKTALSPQAYEKIRNSMSSLLSDHPASYKLWPWAVKQIRDQTLNNTAPYSAYAHIVDVVGAAGDKIHELRRDHRLPGDFDINQMKFEDLEKWWMDWKRENRASESQGEAVYTFHDGWTIQKLDNPEQLQFEGDEMGHCVGDYAHPVMEGETNIYSLRDPKGNPHVTMEIESLRKKFTKDMTYEQLQQEGDTYRAPHEDLDENEPLVDKRGKNMEKPTFAVVQVQGNSNLTPKPEYQRKVKEFLDSLRAKGIEFVRSPEWYHNYDDPENPDNDEEEGVWNTDKLDQMHADFINNPQSWIGDGEDSYGMKRDRKYVQSGLGLDEWVQRTVEQLIYPDMREKYRVGEITEPREMAEQLYYYASLGNYSWAQAKEAMDAGWAALQDVVNKAEEQQGWWDYAPPYEPDDEDWDESAYYEAQEGAYNDFIGSGYGEAKEFLKYLDALFGKHGVPHPRNLSTSLPSYDSMMTHYENEGGIAGMKRPSANSQPIPGAFN